jgi:hypothetical protein
MPTKGEHLAKAISNRRFADALNVSTPTATGWALTALFYSALHYVEAYNAQYNTHFSKHEDLSSDIGRNPVLSSIHDDYKDLSNFSWNARYRPVNYGNTELEEAKACQEAVANLINNHI